jgi:hypothetical protein
MASKTVITVTVGILIGVSPLKDSKLLQFLLDTIGGLGDV